MVVRLAGPEITHALRKTARRRGMLGKIHLMTPEWAGGACRKVRGRHHYHEGVKGIDP